MQIHFQMIIIITLKILLQQKTIYFKFILMSDVGFFIQLIYDKSFVKRQKYKYQVSNNKMIGNFNLNNAYSNLEFCLSLNSQKGRKAKV